MPFNGYACVSFYFYDCAHAACIIFRLPVISSVDYIIGHCNTFWLLNDSNSFFSHFFYFPFLYVFYEICGTLHHRLIFYQFGGFSRFAL